MDISSVLRDMGISLESYRGHSLTVRSPIDGAVVASLTADSNTDIEEKIALSVQAFHSWKNIPAPKRGELIRLFSNELRKMKPALSTLVTIETGKILEEAKGEVQEMIDICDFAVGLSRQLYGLTIASERTHHTMQENWLPLGPVGIISAFNFPVAVWAWNAVLAIVCGNSIIWKPSEKTPVSAIACHVLFDKACKQFAKETGTPLPQGLSQIILGNALSGEQLVASRDIALISATGSSAMGALVGQQVSGRFGKCLLELGGNNAVIITPKADLSIALPSVIFGAIGTTGQRCTTTRRLFIHRSIYEEVYGKIHTAYFTILKHGIGNPLNPGTLLGPLIDKGAYEAMQRALVQAKEEGGEIAFGTRHVINGAEGGYYVTPTLVKMQGQTAIVRQETFAPILYLIPYDTLEEAVALQNDVPQGLSSAIFTTDLREAAYFKQHSDCGIANVNIGTSGAEIGGAFGGEKETGGGRESGSDAWKNYMRRQTSTTYHGHSAPALAQGIKFEF